MKPSNSSNTGKKIQLKTEFKSEYLIFAILLLFFLGIRLTYIFTSDNNLGGDPASMAVMASNQFKYTENNYFIYGEPYIGGAALNSYVAYLPFSILGVHDYSYQIVPLLFSFALAIALYFFMKKHFGKLPAMYSLVLITFSPVFFSRMNILGFAGYMDTLLLFVILTFLFYEIFHQQNSKHSTKLLFLTGALIGIGWWVLEYMVVFLIFFIGFWYLQDKLFFTKKTFFIFLAALLIFLSPLIYYNTTHNFANVKHFMAGNAIHRFACNNHLLPSQMAYGERTIDPCAIFSTGTKPAFSFSVFFFQMLKEIFDNLNYYLFAIILLLYIIAVNFKSVPKLLKAILPVKKYNLNLKEHRKELFILCFFLFWVLIYILSGYTDSRHFFPAYPFIFMLLSISIEKMGEDLSHSLSSSKSNKISSASISFVILAIMVLSCVFSTVFAYQEKNPYSVTPLIDFLNQNNIKYVYTDHPTKWRLMFYGDEKIIASCNICQCVNQYPRYENLMQNTPKTAYIFHQNSSLDDKLIVYLTTNSITYKTQKIDSWIVIYNLSIAIEPIKVLTPCNWEKEQG